MSLKANFTLTKVAGLEGAYDLTTVVKPFLLKNVAKSIKNNEYQI